MNWTTVMPRQHYRVWISYLCALLVLGGMTDFCHARQLAEIKKSKELRICIVPNHPAKATVEPASCRQNCKFSGPVFESAKAFAQSLGMGIEAKFIRVDLEEQYFNNKGKTVWDDSYTPNLLASGKCDFYPSNLTKTEWRQKKLDFITLFPSRMMAIVSKEKQAQIKDVNDLAGKVAAIEKDSSFHTWLTTQNQAAWSTNPVKLTLLSTQESFAAVEAGAVDFTITDADIAIWAARHQLKNSKTAFPIGPTDEIGWAFRKEDKDLQAAAQSFFEQQRKENNSELNQIWKNHFGRSLTEFITLMVLVK